LEALAVEQRADDLFIMLLRRFATQERNVTDRPSATYAPAVFEKDPDAIKAGVKRKDWTHRWRDCSRLARSRWLSRDRHPSNGHGPPP
jgi:hypothetical protein